MPTSSFAESSASFCVSGAFWISGAVRSWAIIKKENWIYDLKLLLWILNSKLWEFWFNQNWKKRWVWVDIWVDVFRNFPIPKNITDDKQK